MSFFGVDEGGSPPDTKRAKPTPPVTCVVDNDHLRSCLPLLKNNCHDDHVTMSLAPDSRLYLGEAALVNAAFDAHGKHTLKAVVGSPRTWLVVSFGDSLRCTMVAIPAQAAAGVPASELVVVALTPTIMQQWLQHTKVRIDLGRDDHLILQPDDNPLAKYELRRQYPDNAHDWRSEEEIFGVQSRSFPIRTPSHEKGFTIRLPVHDFATALRSVVALSEMHVVCRFDMTDSPGSVILRLVSTCVNGSAVHAALRGVESGPVYDMCGGPVRPIASKRATGSALEEAMAAAEQAEMSAPAADVPGRTLFHFTFNSDMYTTLFGDKARTAECEEAMFLHKNGVQVLWFMYTKSGMCFSISHSTK